ncbi:MAG: PEGA domain-containing protein [Candidatus Brocadiaceae bacterium]|nr:PEGA domain-containing protein [Candidatus Brocadiaceae bacterium]
MRHSIVTAAFAVALLTAASGCVERKMYIRSEPAGAPVWIDESYVGMTPLDHSFAHYGLRRVRVGPVRDEDGRLTHEEQVVDWEVEPPWYETFPFDFFAEVLYPEVLLDQHTLPLVVLPNAPEPGHVPAVDPDAVIARGEAYRERALAGFVEELPEGQ